MAGGFLWRSSNPEVILSTNGHPPRFTRVLITRDWFVHVLSVHSGSLAKGTAKDVYI